MSFSLQKHVPEMGMNFFMVEQKSRLVQQKNISKIYAQEPGDLLSLNLSKGHLTIPTKSPAELQGISNNFYRVVKGEGSKGRGFPNLP